MDIGLSVERSVWSPQFLDAQDAGFPGGVSGFD
jgi:hypothetical protein